VPPIGVSTHKNPPPASQCLITRMGGSGQLMGAVAGVAVGDDVVPGTGIPGAGAVEIVADCNICCMIHCVSCDVCAQIGCVNNNTTHQVIRDVRKLKRIIICIIGRRGKKLRERITHRVISR